MKLKLSTALFALAGTAAIAGGTYDISGSSQGMAQNTYIPMGDDRVFVNLNSTYTLPDNGTPVAGMTGDCTGFMEMAVGDGATGAGVCVWADGDGDMWFGPWRVNGMTADSTALGAWHVAGGTGKFAGATGGGSFASLTDAETGESSIDVSGSMVMK